MLLNFRTFVLALGCAFAGIGCQDDFVLGSENDDEKLVVQAVVNADQSMKVHVGHSVSIHEDTSEISIGEAKILFYINGKYAESAIPNEEGWCTSSLKAKSGDAVRLEVQSQGYEDIYAVDVVPNQPRLSDITFNWGMDNSGNIRFAIDDEENADYYALRVSGKFREYILDAGSQVIKDSVFTTKLLSCESKGRFFYSDRNFVATGANEEYFTDELFQNQKLSLDLRVSPLQLEDVNPLKELVAVTVTCLSLNQAQYDLLTELSLRSPVHGGNFRSDNYTSGNITNGYGILACSAQSTLVVQVP